MTKKKQLDQYYKDVGIAPVASMNTYEEMFCAFKCKKKADCREACFGDWNEKKKEFLFQPHPEKDSITVSQEYQDGKYHGDRIPRIVVLSLSAPQPNPGQILSIPQPLEAESKSSPGGQNKHWPKTLVTVRSLLSPFIFCEDESTKEIEKLFVHVRTAKCCSNADGGHMEPGKVYANCGEYLGKELSILKPDVIVTQGNKARDMAKRHAFNAIEQVKGLDLGLDLERPIAQIVNLKEGKQRVYWLKMTFPAWNWMWR